MAYDEMFVLLRGRCILFVGKGDDDSISEIYAQPMAPHTTYNVKKPIWHTHSLSPNAMVLVVENRDTTFDNSPFCKLTGMQRKTLCEMATREYRLRLQLRIVPMALVVPGRFLLQVF